MVIICYNFKFNKIKLTIMDALRKLNSIVDESDPDVDVSLLKKLLS